LLLKPAFLGSLRRAQARVPVQNFAIQRRTLFQLTETKQLRRQFANCIAQLSQVAALILP
jgi:hypothetical protein